MGGIGKWEGGRGNWGGGWGRGKCRGKDKGGNWRRGD